MSKDKPARRRRAAFDADEKDVTKKDVKTPSSSQHSEFHHGVITIMKSIPFMIGSALADPLRGVYGLALGDHRWKTKPGGNTNRVLSNGLLSIPRPEP